MANGDKRMVLTCYITYNQSHVVIIIIIENNIILSPPWQEWHTNGTVTWVILGAIVVNSSHSELVSL